MSVKVHLKVLFNVATDLGELWTQVKDYKGIHLGGENSNYAVYYDGEYEAAASILRICMECAKDGKFFADFHSS